MPPPQRNAPLVVKRHAVEVSITDGVAVTSVDQLFFNPHNRIVEGTYIFPLEDDVALSKFSMFVNGQEVEGKLLGVEEARRIYESIVARMRDPALLEYVGSRMFRARIFPINPKAEVRVRLSYTQMLKAEDGLVRYRYPLNTEKHLGSPIELVSVLVSIDSKIPLKSVFSPSHKVAVSRPSNNKASASYEGKHVYPDKDFDLFYSLSDKEFGLTVLAYRQGGEDGFFLARIAPPASTNAVDVLPKDICFVVDTSGSMAGEKMNQAREALKFCLSNLNREDRFNIVPFSHEAIKFRSVLAPADEESIKEARKFADGLKGSGGTNINDALLAALEDAPESAEGRPYLVVFLTDGQPTIGTTDTDEILKNIRDKNASRVRLFVFGVGYDVNTHLLDLLAEQNRGARDYVVENENLELKLSSFYRKVADPVLADLGLSFGGIGMYDMYPPRLGDLFSGSELVVVARYKSEGPRAVELTGTRRGKGERFVYETTFPGHDLTHEFLPRLWATRKIGFLLDEIRLHGQNKELIDTVVQLATKYGVVTPYTAYLVTEPGGIARRGRGVPAPVLGEALETWLAEGNLDGGRWQTQRAQTAGDLGVPLNGGGGGGGGGAAPARSGKAAVDASMTLRTLGHVDAAEMGDLRLLLMYDDAQADGQLPGSPRREKKELAKHVGTRTFYRISDRWVDGAFDKQKMKTTKVELFTEAYFDLIRKHPELGRCFALGERIVVVVDGAAYETIPAPEPEESEQD